MLPDIVVKLFLYLKILFSCKDIAFEVNVEKLGTLEEVMIRNRKTGISVYNEYYDKVKPSKYRNYMLTNQEAL